MKGKFEVLKFLSHMVMKMLHTNEKAWMKATKFTSRKTLRHDSEIRNNN